MRYQVLLAGLFFYSCFANAQGVCFGCKATYEFHDASMPPEYHRSYTIKVSGGKAELVIYSYGDTLLKEAYPVGDIRAFLFTLKGYRLAGKQIKNTGSCTGGTSESFYSDASFQESSAPYRMVRLKIKAEVYHCGGRDFGGLKGNIADAVTLFKSMIPDFSTKMESTRK